jgi:hypothetical protein
VAGDARGHLLVERLRRRDQQPLGRGGLGDAERIAALAGARPAEDEDRAGLDHSPAFDGIFS